MTPTEFVERIAKVANTCAEIRNATTFGIAFGIPEELSGKAEMEEIEQSLTKRGWQFELATGKFRDVTLIIMFPLGYP